MKYTVDVNINLPRERVIELFDSVDNMYKWQPELVSFEHISGEAGQEGAKSKMLYKMGKREVEMIETITSRNLPDEFSGTYDAKGVHNIIENRFIVVNPETTQWVVTSEFQFKGMMKLMGTLMPRAFRKQTCKFMDRFKAFAESQK